MSDSNYDPYIYWVEPKERGIIDLNEFKVSKSLWKEIKKKIYSDIIFKAISLIF